MVTSVGSDVLRALADPLRWQIVTLLARESLCTTHLVEETGARQTNLSNHLKVLREAGVVETEPCGRWTYYRLKPQALSGLGAELTRLSVAAEETADTGRTRPC
ncbi:metalloregulator ArsR/SmtB family transcription factor [Streptomyces sp. NPDC007346]|uniref:ArsR/SmtB family transcription factor n=1 Tax=Streptomyces sp. NPDC007346 TaxID=3154682 RepID=UPI0034534B40